MLLAGCRSEQDSTQAEREILQGKWALVYQQMDGRKVPDEEVAESLRGQMEFVGEKIHYSVELPGFDFRFSYRLHPEQQPKGIDLMVMATPDGKGVGQTTFGIYRMQGGTLEICHSKTNRPTAFSAEEGSHNVLIALKRESGPK